MAMPRTDRTTSIATPGPWFPLSGLLALGTAGLITLLTETMPAGVLPAMSHDLGVSESAAGQTVTAFALGALLSALPLTRATIGWPRRHLLLSAISGFAVTNTITALSHNFPLTLASRFIGGVVAGLIWALLAGYARRMVAPQQRGKAMAIAMAGTPVALSVGVPAATFLAKAVGWRYAFGLTTAATLALIVWIIATVPNFPGRPKESRLPLARTLRIPGVAPILLVTLIFVLAHNTLYTYIAPFLDSLGMADRVDAVLLTFGLLSLASIWITGAFIDRHLRTLMITSCALFATAALLLGILTGSPVPVFVGTAVWGLAFGGTATLLQTAVAEAAGAAGDVAQSLLVTAWNTGIAGSGILGGLLLGGPGASYLGWSALALLLPTLTIVVGARRNAFPPHTLRDTATTPK
ncbi:MFS transporter [Embleya sp. NPDC008237]|uniref:MFS transporter n=1 Tax=Embleya sp. NPDC008237 TaxID=3363978 RepID=UPI0036E7C58C